MGCIPRSLVWPPVKQKGNTFFFFLCFTENGGGCGERSDRRTEEEEDSGGPAGSLQTGPGERENGNHLVSVCLPQLCSSVLIMWADECWHMWGHKVLHKVSKEN